MFSKRASVILFLGFLSVALSLFREQLILLVLGAGMIFYITVNWIFYSIREKTLYSSEVSITREIGVETAFTEDKIPVTVTITNNSGRDFDFFKVIDHVPSSFDVLGSNMRILKLKGRSECKFSYLAVPKRRGVHRFPGFSVYEGDSRGLFFNKKFFPVISSLTVYPSIEEIDVRGINLPRKSVARALGIHRSRQRGTGSEFAGIREYVYGDAFKSIAWKAYARTNKLMTREFESDINVPVIIFLDTSETMDSGRKGRTKLDYSIKAVVAFSKFALDSNDPVGIYTFTDTIQHYLPPKQGKTQLYSIVKMLAMVEAPLVITGDEVRSGRILNSEDAYLFKIRVLGISPSTQEFDEVDVDRTIMDNYEEILEKVQNHLLRLRKIVVKKEEIGNSRRREHRKELVFDLLSEYFGLKDGDSLRRDKKEAGKYLALYMIGNSITLPPYAVRKKYIEKKSTELGGYSSFYRSVIYQNYMTIVHEHLREIHPDAFVSKNYEKDESKLLEYLENYFKTSFRTRDTGAIIEYLSRYIVENDLKPPLLRVHTAKDAGLYAAIKHAIIRARDPSLFIVISDLEGIEASEKLKEALKLARSYHHDLIILSPFSPWFEKEAGAEEKKDHWTSMLSGISRRFSITKPPLKRRSDINIQKITEELLSLRFIEGRKKFTREMMGIGVPVLSLGPEDLVPMLLSQLIKLKQQKVTVVAR